VGSPIYMSPEGLLQSTYGPKSDVWALGVLLFEMLHGDPPMGFCNSESELKMHINKPINPKAFKPTIPHDLRDLIIKCLEVDYRKRISMQDIQFHPYIQRVSKELGRNLHTMDTSRRNSRFSATQSNYRTDLARSNSASHLDMRSRFGANRSDLVSE
jgi:serine/threonine protein kinase